MINFLDITQRSNFYMKDPFEHKTVFPPAGKIRVIRKVEREMHLRNVMSNKKLRSLITSGKIIVALARYSQRLVDVFLVF
jgi:hypothetical protein